MKLFLSFLRVFHTAKYITISLYIVLNFLQSILFRDCKSDVNFYEPHYRCTSNRETGAAELLEIEVMESEIQHDRRSVTGNTPNDTQIRAEKCCALHHVAAGNSASQYGMLLPHLFTFSVRKPDCHFMSNPWSHIHFFVASDHDNCHWWYIFHSSQLSKLLTFYDRYPIIQIRVSLWLVLHMA